MKNKGQRTKIKLNVKVTWCSNLCYLFSTMTLLVPFDRAHWKNIVSNISSYNDMTRFGGWEGRKRMIKRNMVRNNVLNRVNFSFKFSLLFQRLLVIQSSIKWAIIRELCKLINNLLLARVLCSLQASYHLTLDFCLRHFYFYFGVHLAEIRFYM